VKADVQDWVPANTSYFTFLMRRKLIFISFQVIAISEHKFWDF